MTCTCCGFTVDGYACLGRDSNEGHISTDPPRPFRQEGFYERVWCSYRWSCVTGCSVIHGGPENDEERSHGRDTVCAFLCCLSKPDCDAVHPNRKGREMVPWEWIETFGHATNYYPYRCVRLEDL